MIQLALVANQDIFVALSGARMRFEIKKKAKGKNNTRLLFYFCKSKLYLW